MKIIAIVALAVLIGLYCIYTKLIKAANALKEAASGIDVQLRKRYDLIPNILTIANKFMEHEKELLTEITNLRSMAMQSKPGTATSMAANAKLDSLIGQLKVSMENYPNLKSDQTMMQAMLTYNEVEEHISAARRFYNAALSELRNTAQIFPGSLLAFMVQDQLQSVYYETTEEAKQPINASDFLK